uniref:Uncharacterized protein n=1 Tax=Populus trichocarpa TaxID=3694 RepID=A0A2K1R6W0_POPTR
MADDVIFHKLNSILEILGTIQLNGTKSPNDIQSSFLDCMGFGGVRAISLKSNKCWWTNSSGRESVAESSILPLFIAYSILLTILTTSCQSSNVVVVICGLVETFQQPSNLGSTQKHAAPPLPMCAITRCLNWKRK